MCSVDNKFDYGHSVCIDKTLVCNEYNNCVNGLDEYDCNGTLDLKLSLKVVDTIGKYSK